MRCHERSCAAGSTSACGTSTGRSCARAHPAQLEQQLLRLDRVTPAVTPPCAAPPLDAIWQRCAAYLHLSSSYFDPRLTQFASAAVSSTAVTAPCSCMQRTARVFPVGPTHTQTLQCTLRSSAWSAPSQAAAARTAAAPAACSESETPLVAASVASSAAAPAALAVKTLSLQPPHANVCL